MFATILRKIGIIKSKKIIVFILKFIFFGALKYLDNYLSES